MRFGTPICPSLGRPGAWGLPGHRIFAALAVFRSAGRWSGFPGGLSGPSETRFGTAIIASGENPAPRSRGGSGRRGLPPRGRIWPKSLCFPVAPGSLGGARIGPSGAAAGPGAEGEGGLRGRVRGRPSITGRRRPAAHSTPVAQVAACRASAIDNSKSAEVRAPTCRRRHVQRGRLGARAADRTCGGMRAPRALAGMRCVRGRRAGASKFPYGNTRASRAKVGTRSATKL